MAKTVTWGGSTLGVSLLAVVVVGGEYARKRGHLVLAFLVVTMSVQTLVVNLAKFFIGRGRPRISVLVSTASSSFPSGHTTTAAALYLSFAILVGRGRSRRLQRAAILIAALIAILVGLSRLLLGVHWFTDVAAGLLTGYAVASVCLWLFRFHLGLETRQG